MKRISNYIAVLVMTALLLAGCAQSPAPTGYEFSDMLWERKEKMIVMICVDDHNGMMFNHRRQSRDSAVQERVLRCSENSRLWMNEYSSKLFSEPKPDWLSVDPAFLDRAGSGEYCFVEDQDILPYEDELESIILFQWNRSYPADFHFPADILSHGWTMTESEEFEGSSHEKIIREVYKKDEENK